MKLALPAILLAGAASLLVGAASPEATAAHDRHERLETIGRAFKGVNDQLKRKPVNLVAIRNTTAVLATWLAA